LESIILEYGDVFLDFEESFGHGAIYADARLGLSVVEENQCLIA
jgi:hypothetical protein